MPSPTHYALARYDADAFLMIREADDALGALVQRAVGEDVQLSFEPPGAARAARGNASVLLDIHLVGIEEENDLRASGFSLALAADGSNVRTEAPRYIRLTYWLSAWGNDAASEHDVLGRVVARMAGIAFLPDDLVTQGLRVGDLPVALAVATGPTLAQGVADVWTSLGEPMKAGIQLTLVVPIDSAGETATAAPVIERRLRMTGPPLPPPPALQEPPPGIPGVLMATPARPQPVAPAVPGAKAAERPPLIEELLYAPEPDAPPTRSADPATPGD